jgi:cystathionine beta-lyase/cystathionine gamma-synthase
MVRQAEQLLDQLEEGESAALFASRMAAISSLIRVCPTIRIVFWRGGR